MNDSIKADVLRLYMSHPLPQWTKEQRRHQLATELCRYRFLGLETAMKECRFLDVGCGTGNRSMLAAKHLGVKEFIGFDQSSVSLDIASQVAEEEEFDRFTPVQGNLFELPFEVGFFDVVVSWGVLHHTEDPVRGFKEMARVCRPDDSWVYFSTVVGGTGITTCRKIASVGWPARISRSALN